MMEHEIIVQKVRDARWHRDWADKDWFLLQGTVDVDANFEYMNELFGVTHGAYLLIFEGTNCSGNYLIPKHEELSRVAAEHARDPEFLEKWCSEFIRLSDEITPVLESDPEHFLSRLPSIYPDFERYCAYQIACKAAFTLLFDERDKHITRQLEDARKHSEMFHIISAQALRRASEYIAGKHPDYTPERIRNLTTHELLAYLETDALPDQSILEARSGNIGWYVDDTANIFIPAAEMEDIQAHWLSQTDSHMLVGTGAYAGTVRGTVRIVKRHDDEGFQPGEILVTTMTDPRFLPSMRKALAVVTDSGGLLCHAAITSRELQIPCVVGTLHATQVLKDGDMVEVDAENGAVRIISA